MEFANLRAEVLTGITTGIKINESQYPFTAKFVTGANSIDVDGDVAQWDEVQPVRELDKKFEGRDGMATVTDPGSVKRKASGMLLSFKKRRISPEKLDAMRPVGAASTEKDTAWKNLGLMLGDMKRRHYNEILEYMVVSALLDNQSFTMDGVTVTPDYGLPAAHNLTAAASWAVAGTDIDADVETIKRLPVENAGMPITTAHCGRNVFGYLRKNTAVKTWFTNREGAPADFAKFQTDKISNLFGLEWIEYRHGTTVGGTWTPYIPDDTIIFTGPVDASWCQFHRGSVRYPNSVLGSVKDFTKSYGLTTWARLKDEPPAAWVYQRWAGLFVPVFPSAYVVFDTTT